MADDTSKCKQDVQMCNSSFSLGTTHCGSAIGKYRLEDGSVAEGFYRGCVNCTGKITFGYRKPRWPLDTVRPQHNQVPRDWENVFAIITGLVKVGFCSDTFNC